MWPGICRRSESWTRRVAEAGRSMSWLLSRCLIGSVVDVGFEESKIVRAVSFARRLVLCSENSWHPAGFYVIVSWYWQDKTCRKSLKGLKRRSKTYNPENNCKRFSRLNNLEKFSNTSQQVFASYRLLTTTLLQCAKIIDLEFHHSFPI